LMPLSSLRAMVGALGAGGAPPLQLGRSGAGSASGSTSRAVISSDGSGAAQEQAHKTAGKMNFAFMRRPSLQASIPVGAAIEIAMIRGFAANPHDSRRQRALTHLTCVDAECGRARAC